MKLKDKLVRERNKYHEEVEFKSNQDVIDAIKEVF